MNAVSPGFTEDSVLNSLPPVSQAMIRNWHAEGWTPMGRLGTPADIGNVVSLLCAAEASWVTGQLITADGGASLMNAELPLALQVRSFPTDQARYDPDNNHHPLVDHCQS